MLKLVLIATGGAVGAVLRYGVALTGQRFAASVFPVGTLAVNVTGCFLIGALATIFSESVSIREEYRLALVVGLLGGFTTFSTFGLETLALIQAREWWVAASNILLSNGLGLAAVWIGYRLALRMLAEAPSG